MYAARVIRICYIKCVNFVCVFDSYAILKSREKKNDYSHFTAMQAQNERWNQYLYYVQQNMYTISCVCIWIRAKNERHCLRWYAAATKKRCNRFGASIENTRNTPAYYRCPVFGFTIGSCWRIRKRKNAPRTDSIHAQTFAIQVLADRADFLVCSQEEASRKFSATKRVHCTNSFYYQEPPVYSFINKKFWNWPGEEQSGASTLSLLRFCWCCCIQMDSHFDNCSATHILPRAYTSCELAI